MLGEEGLPLQETRSVAAGDDDAAEQRTTTRRRGEAGRGGGAHGRRRGTTTRRRGARAAEDARRTTAWRGKASPCVLVGALRRREMKELGENAKFSHSPPNYTRKNEL